MPRKHHKAEEIVAKLRQVDVLVSRRDRTLPNRPPSLPRGKSSRPPSRRLPPNRPSHRPHQLLPRSRCSPLHHQRSRRRLRSRSSRRSRQRPLHSRNRQVLPRRHDTPSPTTRLASYRIRREVPRRSFGQYQRPRVIPSSAGEWYNEQPNLATRGHLQNPKG